MGMWMDETIEACACVGMPACALGELVAGLGRAGAGPSLEGRAGPYPARSTTLTTVSSVLQIQILSIGLWVHRVVIYILASFLDSVSILPLSSFLFHPSDELPFMLNK